MPTIADRITEKARKMQEEHEAAQARHVVLVELACNIAELSQRARVEQAAALEQLRKNAEEAKQHAIEADQLREEIRLLTHELLEQRTYFQRLIADLKAMRATAADQVKILFAKVG